MSRTASRGRTAGAAAAASLFAALGDETRFGLVTRLSHDGPMSIARLASGYPVTRQAISKHLRVLERAGLVRGLPEGREVVWRVEQQRLAEARRHLERIAREWEGTLQRLKAFVESAD